MKRFTSVVLVFLISTQLIGCGGDDGAEGTAASTRQVFKNFSIGIPGDWKKVPSDDFANTIPEGTVSLFFKKTDGDDFIQNMNVFKESINTDATSLEYAKANLLLGSKALLDYRPVSTEEALINDVSTVMHVFRARNATTDPLRHYSQTYFAQDKIGYTVTCISKEDDLIQQQLCDSIVKSFLFRG